MKFFLFRLFITVTLFGSSSLYAQVRLPKIFSDNMVLQRDKDIKIWGWASKGETVSVAFHNQVKKVKADKTGKWVVTLSPESAGGPYDLVVKGKNSITLNNVMMGDVWVCSGQSNMEQPVNGWTTVVNYQQEVANANYPDIRLFTVEKNISTTATDDVKGGKWENCSPAVISPFSAVGYFFGRALYKELKVPIGLINSTWGGTDVETWTSRESIDNSDVFGDEIKSLPVLSTDSLLAVRKKKMIQLMQNVQDNLPDATTVNTWKNESVDDRSWTKMQLPSMWENRQLGPVFDGIVWFRKTINISAADAGKSATLSLGTIDDNDETYVNGVKIGATQGYNMNRKYTIPAGILHQGNNVIAVRVEDGGGGGGLWGEEKDMYVEVSNKKQSLVGDWAFRIAEINAGNMGIGANDYPSLLYNAMINPLVPMSIKGAIWYQGENNANRAFQYRKSFPLMISDWRKQWKQGDFPFYFVQLANFNAANGNSLVGSAWAELREAQAMALALPNTGMAVIIDVGESYDIHPKNKQDVGKRLAALALNKTYGENIVCGGPKYESMAVNGNSVSLKFSNVSNNKWMVKDKYGYIKGFEIAGADKKFYYAQARIEGNAIVVSSDAVKNPVAVRYAWCDDPIDANLFNAEGFPAEPFRTDNWRGVTENSKYRIQ